MKKGEVREQVSRSAPSGLSDVVFTQLCSPHSDNPTPAPTPAPVLAGESAASAELQSHDVQAQVRVRLQQASARFVSVCASCNNCCNRASVTSLGLSDSDPVNHGRAVDWLHAVGNAPGNVCGTVGHEAVVSLSVPIFVTRLCALRCHEHVQLGAVGYGGNL